MKSTEIINNRKSLDKNIKNYWNIIYSENVVEKNYKRNYDMKAILNNIFDLANKRIENKLDSICVNMGFTSRTQMPASCLYPIIYTLSEKTEIYVKLGGIKTLDPKLKSKLGKKKMFHTEELTRDYINNLRNKIQLEINGLKKKLEEFNDNAELDVNSAYMMLSDFGKAEAA